MEPIKDKMISNLEFLLSQNDILPLLKRLNRDKTKLDSKFSLDRTSKNVRVFLFDFSKY